MQLPLEMPLGSIAFQHPRAVRAFHEAGIDLAVEHGRSLDEACAMRGLDPAALLAGIFAVAAPPPAIGWDALRDALHAGWEPLSTYLGLPDSGIFRLDEPAAPAPRELPPRTVSWP